MDLRANSSFSLTRGAVIASQMGAIYHASQAVAAAPNLAMAMTSILEILDREAGLGRSVITLVDGRMGGLLVRAVHDGVPVPAKKVFYQPGEGVLGMVVTSGHPLVVEQPATEPRFIRRLGLLDPERPFIAVPILLNSRHVGGVLAAQPHHGNKESLGDQTMMLEIIANLLAQRIRGGCEINLCQATSPTLAETVTSAAARGHLPGRAAADPFNPRLFIHSAATVMNPVFERIRQAARWDTPVLIHGESGTGKELVAHAIHHGSPGAADRPLVKVNCAALSDTLLESELFGHERGAFTGAVMAKPGRFELADGGTLFLDEIGDISPAFQGKLLRVLQEGEFERVGGTRTLQVKVRLITATNVDLFARVREGRFRADLFYRLFVLPIHLPPLRARREDIPLLAGYFLERIGKHQGRLLSLTQGARAVLLDNAWPGNVRELENCLERAAALSIDGTIDATLIQFPDTASGCMTATLTPGARLMDPANPDLTERERVLAAMEQAGWVQAKAARLLGLTPRQTAYRIKTLNIPMRRI
ncbi:MAG: sigma 54-interacting transcriptional regulator [Magnetococcales bacterium]|nr:sigma 54-interacting transcriptional regulator [Magnetococcales bacterium]